MSVKRILVLGGGFAGLWSALGAARKLDELGRGADAVEVTLVNRDGFHNIRVRNYEADLSRVRVPLDDVLGPVGVRRVEGEITGIDLAGQTVAVSAASGQRPLSYDRLYPPFSGDRQEILAAAVPVAQQPPSIHH